MKRETYIYKDYTALDTNFYLYLLETEEKSKKYKEVIDYLKEEIKKTKESWGNSIYNNNEKGMFEVQIEIRLLEELLSKIEKSDK